MQGRRRSGRSARVARLGIAVVLVGLVVLAWGAPVGMARDQDPAIPARFRDGWTGGVPNIDLRPGTGMFVTECRYSHSGFNDPIVHPGHPGNSHHHDFFGNTTTDAFSTVDSLVGRATTCRLEADTAAYWAPALSRDGEHVVPTRSDAYYRVAPGVDRADVKPYPKGLMMIGGDGEATKPQPLSIVAWACDRSRSVSSKPVSCPDGGDLTMRITFPDCWNGRDADVADHREHMTYSTAKGCPGTHPVPVPQLTLVIHYPVTGSVAGLALSPGSLLQGHADFFNAWDSAVLAREIEHCLGRGAMCSSPGGTGGSPPTFSR